MIEIEVKGFKKLADLADRYPGISEKHVAKAITKSLIRIQDSAKRNGPFGTTGQLRQNWNLKIGRFEGALSSGAKANGFPYGTAVEFGTAPHAMMVNEPFKLWARRKGLNPYAVANSIKKKGTKANPFFDKSVSEQEEAVNREFDQAINDILEEI